MMGRMLVRAVLWSLACVLRGIGYLPIILRRIPRPAVTSKRASVAIGLIIVAAIAVWFGQNLSGQTESPAPPTERTMQAERAPGKPNPSTSGVGLTRGTTVKGPRTAAGYTPFARDLTKTIAHSGKAVHITLTSSTLSNAADVKNVLRAIGAATPDSHGRFRGDGIPGLDWLSALLRPDTRTTVALGLQSALVEAIYYVAVMRGVARQRTTDAALTLLRFAFRHDGAFKDECGRLLRKMGTFAVPALVKAPHLPDPLAYRMARYAAYQLDRMNRARPERALEDADPALTIELLRTYGETRLASAVDVVVSRVGDLDRGIRLAARNALLDYMRGQPKETARRALRLRGGRVTEDERPLYFDYLQLARRAVAGAIIHHEDIAQIESGHPPRGGSRWRRVREGQLLRTPSIALAKRLFEEIDQSETRRQLKQLDQLEQAATNSPPTVSEIDRLADRLNATSVDDRLGRLYAKRAASLCAKEETASCAASFARADMLGRKGAAADMYAALAIAPDQPPAATLWFSLLQHPQSAHLEKSGLMRSLVRRANIWMAKLYALILLGVVLLLSGLGWTLRRLQRKSHVLPGEGHIRGPITRPRGA